MAPRNFNPRVHHVQPGSGVSAGNTGRPTRDLEARTNYLKEIADATEAGKLLVHRSQAVASDVLEGEAVFWNDENKRYERAIAATENDPDTSTLVPAASADSLGLVLVKDNATSATIGLLGMAKFSPTQINNATGSTAASPGRYYLSATSPGKLVRQRPAVTVAVAYILGPADDCETDSWVFILPQMRDFLEDHIHFQFELVARPAGTTVPPIPDDQHVITDADALLPGWLPADHESFNDMAPSGAKFGYNLAAHTSLSRAWPPIPVTAAVLELHKPDALLQFQGGVRVMPEYIQMDINGIWWMSNCYDQVPWPTDLNTTPSSSSMSSAGSGSESLSSSAGSDCPTETAMRLILSFIKMTFATNRSVVTSLAPGDDEPIEFVNCDGAPATTGDLIAKLVISAMYAPDEAYGGQVLKSIVDSKLSFGRGYVVEGVIAGSEEVQLSSSRQRGLNPALAISDSNPAVHQGLITLDIQLDPTERELSPEIVRLGDALEQDYLENDFIGFPSGRDSSIRMRFNIPPGGLPLVPKFKIRAVVFGRVEGPLAEMTMKYRRIARPVDGTPTTIDDTWTDIVFDVVTPSDDIDGSGTDLPAGDAIEVESASFTIAASDTVIVMLSRDADAEPDYNSDIGVLRIGGITFSGA